MGDHGPAVERLLVALATVTVPPYLRVKDGQVEDVSGYTYDRDEALKRLGRFIPQGPGTRTGSFQRRSAGRSAAIKTEGGIIPVNMKSGPPASVPMPSQGMVSSHMMSRHDSPRMMRSRYEWSQRHRRAHATGAADHTHPGITPSAQMGEGPQPPRTGVVYEKSTGYRVYRNGKVVGLESSDRNARDLLRYLRDQEKFAKAGGHTPTARDAAVAQYDRSVTGAPRPISEIAAEIRRTWASPNYAAAPYLQAMLSLDKIGDKYGMDSAREIISRFLSNASQFKGEDAKRIKAELKALLKG